MTVLLQDPESFFFLKGTEQSILSLYSIHCYILLCTLYIICVPNAQIDYMN